MNKLTPREIVRELDRYIVGQDEAKRAVAVALRPGEALDLRTLAPLVSRAWAVPIRNDRSLAPEAVAMHMRDAGIDEVAPCATVPAALAAAAAWSRETGNVVVVCGSLFLAGEALVALDAYPWPATAHSVNELLSPAPRL